MSLELLESARSLRTEIEAAGLEAENQCQVSAELIQKLNERGLFSMTIPALYGGQQLEALDTLKVIEELAYADSAVGWCAMIYSTTAVLGSFLPDQWARTVYGPQGDAQRSPITAGGAAPSGKGQVSQTPGYIDTQKPVTPAGRGIHPR